MKTRVRYWNGYYWCRRMGVTGQGRTIKEAWNDMWNLYAEAIRPKIPTTWKEFYSAPNPRRG